MNLNMCDLFQGSVGNMEEPHLYARMSHLKLGVRAGSFSMAIPTSLEQWGTDSAWRPGRADSAFLEGGKDRHWWKRCDKTDRSTSVAQISYHLQPPSLLFHTPHSTQTSPHTLTRSSPASERR